MPVTKTRSVPPSLVDPYLKTERAKEHLETLRNELGAFDKSKPYSFTFEEDVKNSRYRIKFELKDIPFQVPLIAGDLFYCLRSALDQMVFSLAKLTTRDPHGTQFPILDVFNKDSIRRFKQQTCGVPADARQIIESLQPYHGPNTAAVKSRLLWRLNAICNIDKHRRIPASGIAMDFNFPNAPASLRGLVEFEQDNAVSVPLRFKSQMAFDPEVVFQVLFGDMNAGVEITFEGIERIYNFVANRVIPKFTGFFK